MEVRHARHLGHVNTETVIATTLHQFAHEEYFVADFFDRHIEIMDAFKTVSHVIQFMVMRGKERLGTRDGIGGQILRDGPGNAQPIDVSILPDRTRSEDQHNTSIAWTLPA